MLRDATWKLWTDPQASGVKALYNLADDPGETRNLAHDPACEAVRSRMIERILERYICSTMATEIKEYKRVQSVVVGTE